MKNCYYFLPKILSISSLATTNVSQLKFSDVIINFSIAILHQVFNSFVTFNLFYIKKNLTYFTEFWFDLLPIYQLNFSHNADSSQPLSQNENGTRLQRQERERFHPVLWPLFFTIHLHFIAFSARIEFSNATYNR